MLQHKCLSELPLLSWLFVLFLPCICQPRAMDFWHPAGTLQHLLKLSSAEAPTPSAPHKQPLVPVVVLLIRNLAETQHLLSSGQTAPESWLPWAVWQSCTPGWGHPWPGVAARGDTGRYLSPMLLVAELFLKPRNWGILPRIHEGSFQLRE